MEHVIRMVDRENIEINGVLDVISFDEEVVTVETEKGLLVIRGLNLHINKLSLENGELFVEGYTSSISYEENQLVKSQGMFNKIFK